MGTSLSNPVNSKPLNAALLNPNPAPPLLASFSKKAVTSLGDPGSPRAKRPSPTMAARRVLRVQGFRFRV